MDITFNNQVYAGIPTDTFTFDDIVMINDTKGYVEFIGEDIVILIDDKEQMHEAQIKDFKDVYLLSRCYNQSVIDNKWTRSTISFNWRNNLTNN